MAINLVDEWTVTVKEPVHGESRLSEDWKPTDMRRAILLVAHLYIRSYNAFVLDTQRIT